MSLFKESTSISRRNFIKISAATSLLLSLGFHSSADSEIITTEEAEFAEIEMSAWIHIDTTGKVSLYTHRAEMGQGVYQALPQIIAEELEVNLNEVNIVLAKGDNKKYGGQITGGSSSIRSSYKNLLNLGASAREMLIQAAANKWNVAATECYAEAGHVIHRSTKRKFHYGELVVEAKKLPVPQGVKLKKRTEYKLIGKPLIRQDMSLKTNGTAIFGIDKEIPGMLYAAVERNPRLRGVVKSFDYSATLKVPGVRRVFKVRMGVYSTFREGVAVVADSTWAAMQGKKALKVEWDDTGFEHLSTEEIYKRMEDDLKTKEGLSFRTQGDPEAIINSATKKMDVFYQTPYESHSCMEPVNCVAHYQGDKVEIWGPVQAPEWIQDYVGPQLGIPRENVIVNPTFLGGGFGRKAFQDYPHEAVMISKEMGTPIQVVWTREDDMTQGPFRPGITYRCEAVVENGDISAMKVKMSGQNFDHWRGTPKDRANRSTSEGFLKPYFESIKNLTIRDVLFETPIPIIFWRSVYASTNGFAYESFMDEMAHEAGKDPLEFRKAHLKEARIQLQIAKLEEMSGWKTRKKNEGYGVAITEAFGTNVGQVVKVSKTATGGIKIDKVWACADVGWYVNPDTLKAQIEGAIVMGIGAATIHETTFKDGMAVEKNFYDYKMPRITDIPPIEIHIMENEEDATGIGEPGLPPLAPALANAIFDLTGKRLRKLPIDLTTV